MSRFQSSCVVARDKLLLSVLLGSAIFILGCPFRRVVVDYMFDVTGLITTEDGAPVQNAEVTREVNTPVYEALTPIKTAQQFTGVSGGFVFSYLSHERNVKYTITVRKDGFEPQTVSSSVPPAGHHAIRLKKE